MTDYGKLLEAVKSNVTFILVSILIVVCVYFIAKGLEKLIEAKCGMHFNSEKTRVNRLVVIAMFSAISAILMFLNSHCGLLRHFMSLISVKCLRL